MALNDPHAVVVEHIPFAVKNKICICSVCNRNINECHESHASSSMHQTFDTRSEYTKKYPAWPLPKRLPCSRLPADASFVGITTQMADYSPKRIPKRYNKLASSKTLEGCLPSRPGDYSNAATEYTSRYEPKPMQPRFAARRSGWMGSKARLDGTTTQRADFQRWPVGVRAPAKPEEGRKKEGGAFGDATSYKVAFWDKSETMKPVCKQEEELTTDHTECVPKSILRNVHLNKNKHNASSSSPSQIRRQPPHDATPGPAPAIPGTLDATFEDQTTYHHDYTRWETSQARRYHGLRGHLGKGEQPFSGETTYHTHYSPPHLPKCCPSLVQGVV